MSIDAPCLYVGDTRHQRLRPRRHDLRYGLFQIACPLDLLGSLPQRLRLFSLDRFNLFSMTTADYGPPGEGGLEQRLRDLIATNGQPDPARIAVLTMPRILGYAFNPLTVYYGYDAGGRLETLVYEVNNTFGERHHYVLPAMESARGAIRQTCPKAFYVSPFLAMGLRYRFLLKDPGRHLLLVVQDHDDEGLILSASLSARQEALSDARLLRLFFAFPLMTLKVVAGIHWEALILWIKGAPFHPHGRSEQPLPSHQGTKTP